MIPLNPGKTKRLDLYPRFRCEGHYHFFAPQRQRSGSAENTVNPRKLSGGGLIAVTDWRRPLMQRSSDRKIPMNGDDDQLPEDEFSQAQRRFAAFIVW